MNNCCKYIAAFMLLSLVLLSACQQAPSDQITSVTLPPDSVVQSEDNSTHINLDIPVKSINAPDEQFTLKIDATVYYDNFGSAPSYKCLPMEFSDTESAAKVFFGDSYSAVQRSENRDTSDLSWPYKTALPWIETYVLPDVGSLEFTSSLGTIKGSGSSGMDIGSIPNIEKWQTTGDADGDGIASGMKRSREECREQAQSFIDALGLNMLLVRTDVLDVTEFQCYRFYYAHNYDGIPSSIGVNSLTRNYSWGQSLGEYMTIYVCDAGIYKVDAMLYEIIETAEEQPLIGAQDAATKLLEAAQVYPLPIERKTAEEFSIDSVSLVYLPQAVEGDGVDVIGDERGGGLMRNMIPAWQFSTGYSSGEWSAIELYIDARTGEYLQ